MNGFAMNGFKSILVLASMGLLAAGSAGATGLNGVNSMPSRLSMNVTTARQSQAADFGEKVATGLQSGASALTQGASLAVVVECGQQACAVVFPDGDGYRADLQAMTLAPLAAEQGAALRTDTLGQGAALLGGALGGKIVSAAVSSVGTQAGGGSGAAAASYARSSQVQAAPAPLRSRDVGNGRIDLVDPLPDGDYALTLVVEKVVDKATSGLKDTLKTNVRMAAAPAPRVQVVIGFSVAEGVLKVRHDTSKNSIGNIR